MKKLIALLMALTMVMALAACGTSNADVEKEKDKDKETQKDTVEQTTEGTEENLPVSDDTTTAADILNDVWGQYSDDQKPAVIGGHYSNEYTDGPYSYELGYAEDLARTLLIPAEQMDQVIDAATMVHMMNANSMTIGLVRLAEGADMQAFADGVYGTITGNQWTCGFPEKLIIAQVHEDYVLIAYGLNDLLDVFEGYLDARWSVSDFYNEAIE